MEHNNLTFDLKNIEETIFSESYLKAALKKGNNEIKRVREGKEGKNTIKQKRSNRNRIKLYFLVC